METIIQYLFLHQWQRKLIALLIAAIIWIAVNHSITATKTIPFVPIRVVNLSTDKTIQGLLPNGFLTKRATLTLTGTKDVIEQLEPGDLEVLLDVSNLPNEGIVQITRKNLVSLNPDINLLNHITQVTHPEFVIKMSAMLTEKISVIIQPPIGEAPEGYEFLDIWPMALTHTVSGPQEQILNLKNKGLELTFNLSDITKEQLDALKSASESYDDEISFFVPNQWKKVTIPFMNNMQETINDPEAKNLQIAFLREEPHPIQGDVPVRVFYPLKYSSTLNPKTYPLETNAFVDFKNDLSVLTIPLFAHNVSKLFLNVVKDNLELDIVAAPKTEREKLEWSIGFIDYPHLEDTYVAFLISNTKNTTVGTQAKVQEREKFFRQRFRNFLQKLTLHMANQHALELDSTLQDNKTVIHIPNAQLNAPTKSQEASSNAR